MTPNAAALAGGWFRRAVVFACALAAVFLVLGMIATWRLVGRAELPEQAGWLLVLMLPLGTASYFLRFARWHVLTRRLAPNLGLAPSLRIYAAGFAMGLTPGRVGEFCKFPLLREETGVPEALAAPIFPLERLTEAASFTALAVVGGLFSHVALGRLGPGAIAAVVAVPALAVVGVLLRFSRRRRETSTSRSWLRMLLDGAATAAEARALATAMACALLARVCDTGLFWCAAAAAGLTLPLAGAALAWGLAGLAGGLLLLPGGVGAAEGSLVATATVFGADPGVALAAALLARSLSLWAWIPAGLYFAVRAAARIGAAELRGVARA